MGGMYCENYEIGILTQSGKMLSRKGNAGDVLNLLPWLKKQNADGANIYIRPDAGKFNAGLVLVDDLSYATLLALTKDGYTPSAVIETSPGNFQAWVRIADYYAEVPPGLATACAKHLARSYNADPNSADWKHFGRLAGFTNRKPKHADSNGRFPFVLCRSANHLVCESGPRLLMDLELRMAHEPMKRRAPDAPTDAAAYAAMFEQTRDVIAAARKIAQAVLQKHASIDLSRVDFAVARELCLQRFSDDQIVEALRHSSQDLETRKQGHVDDYLTRTVRKARAAADAQLL